MKWCNLYSCWCTDVEEILDKQAIICDLECNGCVFAAKA